MSFLAWRVVLLPGDVAELTQQLHVSDPEVLRAEDRRVQTSLSLEHLRAMTRARDRPQP